MILITWLDIGYDEVNVAVDVAYTPAEPDVGIFAPELEIEVVRRKDNGAEIPESVWQSDSNFRIRVDNEFGAAKEFAIEARCDECSRPTNGRYCGWCHNPSL